MNDLTEAQNTTLPLLIDRAATALTSAKTSAEVLEARDMASIAYDAAKSAGRMARAKKAHEQVIAAVYRAQADALLIEARAKMRLADEYDDAQKRGEVAKVGNPSIVGGDNDRATAADLGLRRDEIHEARRIRDAERNDPGKIEGALSGMVQRGEEPTKAKLRREIAPNDEAKPEPEVEESKERVRIRREFRRLTKAAQEDEFVNVREENWTLRRELRAAKQEIKRLKELNQELADDDKNAVAVRYEAKVKNSERARFQAEEKAAAALRQVYAIQKEMKRITGQEIVL